MLARLPIETRRRAPTPPDTPGKDSDLEVLIREGSGRRLRCRTCGQGVARDESRIEIDGRHVHRRINPAGIDFEFGCFGEAEGAGVVGEPTTEYSWFAGYSWSFSICRRCASHLGWFFEGLALESGCPSFHGLILNRLVIEDSSDLEQ